MEDNIKGITVEIGGDTAPLQKSLKAVNSTVNGLQRELSAVDRALKLNPSNTELLAQKQELLGQAVEAARDKVEALQAAKDKADAEMANGTEVNQTQYRLLQREIAFASDKLGKLTAAQQGFQRASDGSAAVVEAQADAAAVAAKQQKELADGVTLTEKRLALEQAELERSTAALDENKDKVKIAAATRDSLVRQISTQSDKVSLLRKQLDMLTVAEGDNKQAILEKRTELTKAETELDNYKKKLKDTSDVLKEFGGKVGSAVKKGLVAAGTGIVAAGTAAGKFTTDYQQAVNGFAAATGIAGDGLDGFADAMKNIYAGNYGEDMADIGAAMATVAQNAKNLDPSNIERMTTDALRLRDTFDFDISESMRAANMLVDQFGLSGEEAFNLIAQGAQQGLNKNDDLLDTINEYAVHFKQLGFDAEDMFNSLSSGAENGTFSVDKLGDAVKEFGIRVKDGTADDAFKELGLNADATKQAFVEGGDAATDAFKQVNGALFAMDDKVKQNQLGVELYGTMWEDLGAEGVQALSGLNDQFDRTQASMDELDAVKYDDLASSLGELGRTVQTDVLLPLGQELVPLLRDLADRIKEMDFSAIGEQIAGAFTWIVEHGSQILSIIAGIATAFGVLKIASSITAIGIALMSIGGPTTLIIAGAAALVAGLVTLWNTNDGFREGVINAWNAIQETAAAVWGGLVAFFTEIIPNAWNSVVAFFQAAPAALGAVWDSIKAFFVNGWNAIVEFFTVSVPAWIASLAAWFDQLPYKIGYTLGQALQKVREWGANVKTFVTETIPQVIENIGTWFSQLPGRIWTSLSQAVQKITAWGSQTAASASAAAANTVSTVATWFAQLPGRIWTFLTEAVQKLIAWGAEMVSTGKAKMSEVVTAVTTTLQQLPGKVVSVGSDVIRGIWNGITNMAGWIKGKITGWCGDFVQGFKDALGIHSPSREFRDEVGKHIPAGIAKGVEKTESVAIKTVQELSKYLLDEASSWVEDKKFFNKLTLQEELDFWMDLRRMTELQADELHEIDKKIYTAKQSLLAEQQAAEEKLRQEQEQALAEYEQNLNSRADALRGFAGVFDEVARDGDVSGKQLLQNLQGQVDAFHEWQDGLAALEARGVGADLLAELREQGPKAVDEITALTKLSDSELARYGALYAEKTRLALEQAQAEMDGFNVPLTIGGGEQGIAKTVAQTLGVIGGMLSGGIAGQAVSLAQLARQAVAGMSGLGGLPESVSNLNTAAQYAVTPVPQSGSSGDPAAWREAFAKALGDALVEGMTLIGDAIFDAIPKQVDFYLDSTRMARASWDAYDDEGSRRRRYYAPTREDIARIAMGVMPKTL